MLNMIVHVVRESWRVLEQAPIYVLFGILVRLKVFFRVLSCNFFSSCGEVLRPDHPRPGRHSVWLRQETCIR
jgi:hypothetical protein